MRTHILLPYKAESCSLCFFAMEITNSRNPEPSNLTYSIFTSTRDVQKYIYFDCSKRLGARGQVKISCFSHKKVAFYRIDFISGLLPRKNI